jgi:hypothetical protein
VTLLRVLLSCGLLEGPHEINQMIRGTLGPVRTFKEARNVTRDVRDLAAKGFSSEEARIFDFISSYCLEGNSVLYPGDNFHGRFSGMQSPERDWNALLDCISCAEKIISIIGERVCYNIFK